MTDRGKRPKDAAESDDDTTVEEGTSIIEWLAAAAAAVLFVAMIGYMAFIGLREIDGSPKIGITTLPPVQQGNVFHVGFIAMNSGDATATNLGIRAVLMEGDRNVESQEVTIDYLPMRSNRGGGFFFEHDPAKYRLTVTATTYLDP